MSNTEFAIAVTITCAAGAGPIIEVFLPDSSASAQLVIALVIGGVVGRMAVRSTAKSE